MEKGLQLAVAYQHCYSKALRSLKQDVLQGRYGKPISMRALSLTGRSDLYYQRNRWAGRFYDEEGRCIMDGVLHNEASHSLQSLLYLLGDDGLDSAADVETVRGEWCRAHAIQSYDTAVVSVRTAQCPSVLMAATHNWAGRDTHRYRYVWEHGYAEGDWSQDPRLIVHSEDGIIDYGDCACPPREELQIFLDCLRSGQPVPCSVHSAKAEVAVCTGMYLSAGWIRTLPEHELQLVRGAAIPPTRAACSPPPPACPPCWSYAIKRGSFPLIWAVSWAAKARPLPWKPFYVVLRDKHFSKKPATNALPVFFVVCHGGQASPCRRVFPWCSGRRSAQANDVPAAGG